MSVRPEALAVQALQEYLLRKLPAKVATINAARYATLKAARAGPYVVPAGATLTIANDRTAAGTAYAITAGTRTAAQIVVDLGLCVEATASADTDGRLVLSTEGGPTEGAPVCVAVHAASWLNVFGWDLGGEHDARAAITAPQRKGVSDGYGATPPDAGRTFWVVIADRDSSPVAPDNRRDETQVLLSLDVWVPDRIGNQQRSKENLGAVLQCLREVLLTPEGRQLGRGATGDIVFGAIHRTRIAGTAKAIAEAPGVLFDTASLTVSLKIYEVP